LQFFHSLGLRPLPDGLHLLLLHLDTFRADDIAEELDSGPVELAFLELQI